MPCAPSYRATLEDSLAPLHEIEQLYSPVALTNGFDPGSMILTELIIQHELAGKRLWITCQVMHKFAAVQSGLRLLPLTAVPEVVVEWLHYFAQCFEVADVFSPVTKRLQRLIPPFH